jgi:glyoxylase-like metal-dependent hydrolase (beta-lactamase superfamily II)/ferredoxin
MARASDRIAENVDGDFFVDRSCIDCDLCRQLAPATFARSERASQSFVGRQPSDAASEHRALMALVTCPTSSIGTTRKHDTRAAARALPEEIARDLYFCGWASESSYGAASWLLRRPDGNVLVDSPRAASTLMSRLDELGGVRFMFLTHRDDVADHAAFRARFGCERIIHAADAVGDTRHAERILDGIEPMALARDLLVVPVPGHTKGSSVLIARETFAFTGDHVWATDDETELEAGRSVCWYSWPEQRRSMERLATHRFTHVLPGHGRRFQTDTIEAMQQELRRLAAAM